MVKGGKVSSKRRVNPRIRSNYKGSDDSDEDYVVSDEEKLVSEDLEEDDCSSASEESYGVFAEEEEEEEVKWARKNSRSRAKKDSFIVEGEEEEDEEEMEKMRQNGRSRAKNRFVVDEEEEEDYEPEEEEDEEEIKKVGKNGGSRAKKGKDRFTADEEEYELEEEEEEEEEEEKDVRKVARSKSQNGSSGREKNGAKLSQKRRRTLSEEMADRDYDDEDDDDDDYDEEFTPDEDDFSELEEESRVKKKKSNVKVDKRRLKKKGPVRRKSKKPLRKKQKKNRTLRRKVRSDDEDDDDFMDSNLSIREKNEKKRPKKRRRFVAPSDSDFASSGSSDCDYTISEEEREQVREAKQLLLEPNLRSSLPSEKIQETEIVQLPRKPPGRKGKEKIESVKVEVVKQVCGICLSEEDKRRVRGTLDCCTHYFCFSCIMEWGKVESRCPLCKQRFKTISKPTRAGTDLREVVMTVPERDQVYQPTEEELRSYLDPYENVICTECHEGGDDGLMLLCDVCDSPAHTYCVGLGREVPEGNWYCEGCRPVALGSSSSQVQGWLNEQRTTNNILPNRRSPAVSFGEGLEIDLNSASSPRSYVTQGFGNSSPWFHVGGFQAVSPGSGAGAPTLSGRRLMHRHIHQLISANRMNYLASRNERSSSANLGTDNLNAQAAQERETRTDGMERSFHTFFEDRSQENPSLQLQNNDIFSSTSSQRRQVFQDPTTTSTDRPSCGTLWPGLTDDSRDTISGHVQTHNFSSRPNIGSDGGASPNTDMGPGDFLRAKEQLQSLVISHLKSLSRDKDLGHSTTTFQDIARSAIHTILAACDLEHTGSEVHPVPPPSPCPHIELMAGKTSLMRGCCSSCFGQLVEDIVKRVMEYKLSPWLRLAL